VNDYDNLEVFQRIKDFSNNKVIVHVQISLLTLTLRAQRVFLAASCVSFTSEN
jgi:hypothetical protein